MDETLMNSLQLEKAGCPWVQAERSPVTIPISDYRKTPTTLDYSKFYIVLFLGFFVLFGIYNIMDLGR